MKHFLLLTIFLSVSITDILACTCIGTDTVKEARKESNSVFLGEVISIDTIRTIDTIGVVGDFVDVKETSIIKYSFKVVETFKGKEKAIVVVFTDGNGDDCGFTFLENKKYIVYAKWNKNIIKKKRVLYTNRCMRTRTFSETEYNEIKKLRRFCNRRKSSK